MYEIMKVRNVWKHEKCEKFEKIKIWTMKSMKVSKIWNHEKDEKYESIKSMKATTMRIQEKKTRRVEQMPAPSSEQAAIMIIIIIIIIYDLLSSWSFMMNYCDSTKTE